MKDKKLTAREFLERAKELTKLLRSNYQELDHNQGRLLTGNLNQFGEQSLVADWSLEEVVIKFWQKTPWRIGWIAEEHGQLLNNQQVDYVGYLDGLDGSSVYQANEGGRCGTMMSIYQANDQTFAGYVGSLIVDYGYQSLGGNCSYIAANGLGAWADPVKPGNYLPINVTDNVSLIWLNKNLIAYADLYFKTVGQVAEKMKDISFYYLKASMPYYVDLAQGYAWLVIECTRKQSLEIASAYPLIHEAGGVMLRLDCGQEIGQLERLFAQADQQIVITAPSAEVACCLRANYYD